MKYLLLNLSGFNQPVVSEETRGRDERVLVLFEFSDGSVWQMIHSCPSTSHMTLIYGS